MPLQFVVRPEQQTMLTTELGNFKLLIESFKKIISYGDNFETTDYPDDAVIEIFNKNCS
jgi:hypothetical protein